MTLKITAINAITNSTWIIPLALYAKYPAAQIIIKMTAITYKRLLIGFFYTAKLRQANRFCFTRLLKTLTDFAGFITETVFDKVLFSK